MTTSKMRVLLLTSHLTPKDLTLTQVLVYLSLATVFSLQSLFVLIDPSTQLQRVGRKLPQVEPSFC